MPLPVSVTRMTALLPSVLMLDGVGQQVVYHFLHLFLVIPYFEAVCFLLEVEADLFGAGIFQEKQIVFV